MKLEKGTIQLPEIDLENEATSQGVQWSELMMMVQGISIKEAKRKARWKPKK
jgi:cytochrome oxidase assembly protein ShyY1